MFETTLVASRRQNVPRQRLLALPVAIAIHALAVTVFVVGQLWATAPIPEPTLMVGFHQPPPPPPAARRGTPRPQAATSGEVPKPKPDQPPTSVPQDTVLPLPQGPTEPTGDGEEGIVGGDPDGKGTGVPGSRPGDGAVQTETPLIDESPKIIGGAIEAPVLTRRIDPRYPEIARKAKLQGVVILEAIIDREGRVVDGRILRDIGLGCGDAALDAIRAWRYEPATLNGRRVSVYLTITVHFQLS